MTRWTQALVFRLTLMGAVFAGVFAQKLVLIEGYGSDLPFWDAWDGEADVVFRPYVTHTFSAQALFKAHNEHRILFTRVLTLGLFLANDREWNGRLEVVANAALCALTTALLCALALSAVPGWAGLALSALAVYLVGGPVSNENTLLGFQSQFYFLLLVPGLHLWASTSARPRSPLWWCAPLLGVAGLFTMASGFFSAIAVVGIAALEGLRRRRIDPEILWLGLPNAAIALAGWCLKVTIPEHASLQASTPGPWTDAWLHQFSWPVRDLWFAPFAAAPLAIAVAAYLRGKLSLRTHAFLVGAGIWAWLQYAAIAYARGASYHGYASRYTDILSAAVLINVALGIIVCRTACARRVGWAVAAFTLAYAGSAIWGYSRLVADTRIDPLLLLPTYNRSRIETVRSFLADADASFYTKEPWSELPYPSSQRLGQLLSDPVIRAMLPASVSPGLPLAADKAATTATVPYRNELSSGAPPRKFHAIVLGLAPPGGESRLLTEPFQARHSTVSLYFSGTFDPTRDTLTLVSASGEQVLPTAIPPASRTVWKRVNFAVAPGTYRLSAAHFGDGWVALTQPFSEPRLSRLAEKLTHAGPFFGWLSVAFALVSIGVISSEKLTQLWLSQRFLGHGRPDR